MKCEICGRGPAQGVSVFRQNSKGEKGIWRCIEHNEADIDRTVAAVVIAAEDANSQEQP